MKVLCLAASILLSFSVIAQQKAPDTKNDLAKKKIKTAPLEEMVSTINNSLDAANTDLVESNLEVSTATITFKTVYSKEGGGGFKIFVKAKKQWQWERASSLSFEYVKPPVDSLITEMRPPKFSKNLAQAIISGAKQWQAAKETISGLKKDKFTVDVSFTIKNKNQVGFEIEIWGIGVDASADFNNTAVHSVSITFQEIKNKQS